MASCWDLTINKSTLFQVMAWTIRQQAFTWTNDDQDLWRSDSTNNPSLRIRSYVTLQPITGLGFNDLSPVPESDIIHEIRPPRTSSALPTTLTSLLMALRLYDARTLWAWGSSCCFNVCQGASENTSPWLHDSWEGDTSGTWETTHRNTHDTGTNCRKEKTFIMFMSPKMISSAIK